MLFTESLAAFGDPDDNASVAHGVSGVVERLLSLVHIAVLGESACRCDNDVGLLFHLDGVQAVKELAALAVRVNDVSRYALDDLLMLVEYDVAYKFRGAETARFLDVLAYGVAVKATCRRVGLYHKAVVGLDCRTGGNAGHYRLVSAAVSCKIVIFDISDENSQIGACDDSEDLNGCAARGSSHIDAVVFGVGIYAFYAVVDVVADERAHLLFGLCAVAAESEYNCDLAVVNACLVKLVEKRGDYFI